MVRFGDCIHGRRLLAARRQRSTRRISRYRTISARSPSVAWHIRAALLGVVNQLASSGSGFDWFHSEDGAKIAKVNEAMQGEQKSRPQNILWCRFCTIIYFFHESSRFCTYIIHFCHNLGSRNDPSELIPSLGK